MNKKLATSIAALLLSMGCFAAQAATQYFMRVPAPVHSAVLALPSAATSGSSGSTTPVQDPTPPEPAKPQGAFTPVTSADFGAVAIGSSTSLVFHFTNTGTVPITGAFVDFSGNSAFKNSGSSRNNTCGLAASKVTLNPGATCSAYAAFTPTESGQAVGSIQLESADVAGPVATLAITGTGGTPIPALSANAQAGLDFGTVAVGSVVTRTFTVSNNGTAPYSFSQPGVWDSNRATWMAGSSVSSTCQLTGSQYVVAAGQSCTVSVTLTASLGQQSGLVVMTYSPSSLGYGSVNAKITGQ